MDTIITSQQPVEALQVPNLMVRQATVCGANYGTMHHRLALLQFLLDASPQGIMLTDQGGSLVLRNALLKRMFGIAGTLGEGRGWIESFASMGKNDDRLYRLLTLILKENNNETLDIFELKSGLVLECRTYYRMIEQVGEYFRIWYFQDCTEQHRREQDLQQLSMHDPLTGLSNRAFFNIQMGKLRQSRQYPVALIMLDVDGLKKMNDTRGHLAGDALLRQVALILRRACRKGDVIARLGGDEFALMLAQADASAVGQIMDRVHGLLNLHNIRNPALPISLSMGSALAYGEVELESLVARADEAMYFDRRIRRAKEAMLESPR